MSAPSKTNGQVHEQFHDVALARDAYFSGALQPAAEVPAAELAPPVRTVTSDPDQEESDRKVTRQQLLDQTLQLEMLLSLWRLEFGCLDGFREAHPQYADALEAALYPSYPVPQIEEDYVSQIALQLFSHQAA